MQLNNLSPESRTMLKRCFEDLGLSQPSPSMHCEEAFAILLRGLTVFVLALAKQIEPKEPIDGPTG